MTCDAAAWREAAARQAGLRFRSPESWELGSALYAVEVVGQKSSGVCERLWKDHRVVTRAFHTAKLNTLRLSLNAANTEDEVDRVLEGLASV